MWVKLELQALLKLWIAIQRGDVPPYSMDSLMWLGNAMDALWYPFDAMDFVACITGTERARQHQ